MLLYSLVIPLGYHVEATCRARPMKREPPEYVSRLCWNVFGNPRPNGAGRMLVEYVSCYLRYNKSVFDVLCAAHGGDVTMLRGMLFVWIVCIGYGDN